MEIRAILARKIGFASHQNAVPILRDLVIDNVTDVDCDHLTLTLSADPPFLQARTWRIDHVSAHTAISVQDRQVHLNASFLGDLTESISGTVELRLEAEGVTLASLCEPIEILARDYWGGAGSMAELLPVYAMPNDPAVDRILKAASDTLRRAGRPDAIDGYTAKSRERVWEITSALWSAICGLGLSYVLPPASFETTGQKVRTPGAILSGRVGTCLDTALLFAAALEQAGLNPVLVLTRGHAFVGVWLQPVEFSALVIDEAAALRRRVDLKDLLLFETTLVTQANPPSFSQAERAAMRLIAEDAADHFEIAIDVRRARMQKIRPLSTAGDLHAIRTPDTPAPANEPLEAAPSLPDFDVEVAPDVDAVRDRVLLWQRRLLNLTTSNRLLNVPDGSKAIRLACPDPGALEDRLAAGDRIKILPLPDLSVGGRDAAIYESETKESLRHEVTAAALNRGEVLAPLTKDKLEAGLIDLYRKARSDLDEGGANTLFLALGFLKWKKKPEDQRSYRAPLILLPVRLERKSALSGVLMRSHQDEPRFNLTLLELLRQDYELTIPGLEGALPCDESGIDVAGIWTMVRRAIRDMPGFEVVTDTMLGTFSFAKYLMWKDLVDRADQLKESPVVRHLIERSEGSLLRQGDLPRAEDLDISVDPAQLFTPLAADSSQLAAVAASALGYSFVLDGPPGTGKSQTIANIIAQNLALGRRVLFVAEKIAALNVVQRRLAEKGLGAFCLELHSAKATKAEVLKHLDAAWTSRDSITEAEWHKEAAEARRLRDGLNAYVRLLHHRHGNGLTLHGAIGRVTRDWQEGMPRIDFGPPDRHDADAYAGLRDIARRLGLARAAIADLTSGFDGIDVDQWSNGWQDSLVAAARALITAVKSQQVAFDALLEAVEIPLEAVDEAEIARVHAFIATLLDTYGKDLRLAFAPDIVDRIGKAAEAIKLVEAYRAEEHALSARYPADAVRHLDLHQLRCDFLEAGDKFSFLATRAKKKVARSLGISAGVYERVDPERDLPRLETMSRLLPQIDQAGAALGDMPGWSGIDTDISALVANCGDAQRLRGAMRHVASDNEHLRTVLVGVATLLFQQNSKLQPDGIIARTKLRSQEAHTALAHTMEKFLSLSGAQDKPGLEESLNRAAATVRYAPRLQAWTNWRRACAEATAAGLMPLAKAVEEGRVSADAVSATFETVYCHWFATALIDSEPLLKQFASSVHGDDIAAFRQVDERLNALSVRYIRAKLSGRIPAKTDATAGDGYAVLRSQLLARNQKPIRQLATEMGDALTTLAPCMMMSPLSIAQYLPANQALFDLVIFDEASQITPWDAIGAMARGKQVIVAGDHRQMPPSNIFDRSPGATDGDGDTEPDMESILDECKSAGLRSHSLDWHYRSRHESLIAFSNYHYYGNALVTFPAPIRRESAVSWQRISGVYSRGKGNGRTNAIEAQAIVDEAVARLTDPGFVNLDGTRKTLAIITLNADQQKLIEDLLDRARRINPAIEPHFDESLSEPVVVKNLETVQGDERDLILLGISFGPTEPEAPTMSMNFGPLNKEGGWRRLNVAITRARQEMVVFTSFDPGMIDLHRTSARAIADLKHFIEFALRGPRALAQADKGSLGGYESPFEEGVATELTRRGWTVVPQIGVSRFRVDLGIVHPDRPGDYLVGVECDGATYHSAATARDRDKVRAAILKGLGWDLVRIWSTEWWIDRQGSADKLDAAIRELLEVSRRRAAEEAEARAAAASKPPIEIFEPFEPEPRQGSDTVEPGDQTFVCSEPIAPVPAYARVSAPVPPPNSKPYLMADLSDLEARVDPPAFYEPLYNAFLAELIARIIVAEAPLSDTQLVQRIARCHGFQRAGRIIRERVMAIATSRHHVEQDMLGGVCIWPDQNAPLLWQGYRVSPNEDLMRLIEDIPLVELAIAAESTFGEDAALEVARLLGIRRLSSPARSRIEAAIQLNEIASRPLQLASAISN